MRISFHRKVGRRCFCLGWGDNLGFGYPKTKYRNVRGPKGDSKLEVSVIALLELRVKAGELKDLKLQHTVRFRHGVEKKGYRVDASAVDVATGNRHFFEAKGFEQDDWPWKQLVWSFCGPGPLHVFKGTYKNPIEVKVINPDPNRHVSVDA